MRELDNNAHSVFLLYYHLIMVTKYRRKVFDEKISARGKEIFECIAPNYGIKQPAAEERVSADPEETVEGSVLEPELLPSDGRRGADRSDQGVYRDTGGKGK